jgi:hypothetical protein
VVLGEPAVTPAVAETLQTSGESPPVISAGAVAAGSCQSQSTALSRQAAKTAAAGVPWFASRGRGALAVATATTVGSFRAIYYARGRVAVSRGHTTISTKLKTKIHVG